MRVSTSKRKAIVTLFLVGWSPIELGRLFRLKKLDVEQVIRDGTRRA